MKTILISTLAINQTKFWIKLIQKLDQLGYKFIVFSYDQESNAILEKNKIHYYDIYRESSYIDHTPQNYIKNLGLKLSHEKIAYNIYRSDFLKNKFWTYYNTLHRILKDFNKSEAIILQELGGYISVQSLFAVAKKLQFEHVFVEPAFFKGRVFYIINTLMPVSPSKDTKTEDYRLSKGYIEKILKGNVINIPEKDKYNYRSTFRKIFRLYQSSRLIKKIYLKYVKRQKQEFNHIKHHTLTHLKMFLRQIAYKIFNKYTSDIPKEKYIYFPLHVPNDISLTLRAPEYLDQSLVIDYLCRIAPLDYLVLIKEHPAMKGAFLYGDIVKLINNYDNLRFIDPNVNNFNLLKNADLVVTINSKAGAESILLKRKTVVLGPAFYSNFQSVYKISFNNLKNQIESLLFEQSTEVDYFDDFAGIWKTSYPGELYLDSEDNIGKFVQGFIKFLEDNYENK